MPSSKISSLKSTSNISHSFLYWWRMGKSKTMLSSNRYLRSIMKLIKHLYIFSASSFKHRVISNRIVGSKLYWMNYVIFFKSASSPTTPSINLNNQRSISSYKMKKPSTWFTSRLKRSVISRVRREANREVNNEGIAIWVNRKVIMGNLKW